MKLWTYEVRAVNPEERDDDGLWWPRKVWGTKEEARAAADQYSRSEWEGNRDLEGELPGLEDFKPLVWSLAINEPNGDEFAEDEYNGDEFTLVVVAWEPQAIIVKGYNDHENA
jgi:hypothetical protein